MANSIMDRTGCPGKYWLLCVLYVVGLLNCLANAKGQIPNSVVTGEVTDVSPYIEFHYWQPVFYDDELCSGKEKLGRWCGPTDRIGDVLTYWILTNDTKKCVARSNVRPAKDDMFPNRRAKPPDKPILKFPNLANLYVGILLSTQSFFLAGIDDVEKAQSSAYGATTMFAITFFASLGGIWYDSMYKKEPDEDFEGKYHLSKDDVPSYGAAN